MSDVIKDIFFRIHTQFVDQRMATNPGMPAATTGTGSAASQQATGDVRLAAASGDAVRMLQQFTAALQSTVAQIGVARGGLAASGVGGTVNANAAAAVARSAHAGGSTSAHAGGSTSAPYGADGSDPYRINHSWKWNGQEYFYTGWDRAPLSTRRRGPYAAPDMDVHASKWWDRTIPLDTSRGAAASPARDPREYWSVLHGGHVIPPPPAPPQFDLRYKDFIDDARAQANRFIQPRGPYGPFLPPPSMASRAYGAMSGVGNWLSQPLVGGQADPINPMAAYGDAMSMYWMARSGNVMGAGLHGAGRIGSYAPYISRGAGIAGAVAIGAYSAYDFSTRGATYTGRPGETFGDPNVGRIFDRFSGRFDTGPSLGLPNTSLADPNRFLTKTDMYLQSLDRTAGGPSAMERATNPFYMLPDRSYAEYADKLGLGWAYNFAIGRPRFANEGASGPAARNVESGMWYENLYDRVASSVGLETISGARQERFNAYRDATMSRSSEIRRINNARISGGITAEADLRLGRAETLADTGFASTQILASTRYTADFDNPYTKFGTNRLTDLRVEAVRRASEIAAEEDFRRKRGDAAPGVGHLARIHLSEDEKRESWSREAKAIGLSTTARMNEISGLRGALSDFQRQADISGGFMLEVGMMRPDQRIFHGNLAKKIESGGVGSLTEWELQQAASSGSRVAQEKLREKFKDEAEYIRGQYSPNLTPEQRAKEAEERRKNFAGTDYGKASEEVDKISKKIAELGGDVSASIDKSGEAMIGALESLFNAIMDRLSRMESDIKGKGAAPAPS